MPELPEIEGLRRRLEADGLGRRIAGVDLRDPGCLRGARAADLAGALEGTAFTAARRHGKVLFARAGGDGPWLAMHFGMTGRLVLSDGASAVPRHARLVVVFEDGGRLAFDNPRRLGRLDLADGPEAWTAAEGLGPDALAISRDAFARRVGASRGMIKPALMDQSRIAGIGNVWSDEILFQAGIAPHGRAGALDAAALGALHDTLRRVLAKAVDAEGEPERLPPGWLRPHREAGARCPRCSGPIESRKVSGRRALWCPHCQRLPRRPR